MILTFGRREQSPRAGETSGQQAGRICKMHRFQCFPTQLAPEAAEKNPPNQIPLLNPGEQQLGDGDQGVSIFANHLDAEISLAFCQQTKLAGVDVLL